jgi:uncharacterized membrane protein YcaP (DUF421 family)
METVLQSLLIPGVPVIEKVLRAILVYLFLVLLLRLAGRRELAQINTFDLVVLLTLSNTVQNAIIGNDNSLLGGIIGATTLVLTNMAMVRFLHRHRALRRWLEGEPVVLVRHGRLVRANLEREAIAEDELLAALRRQGAADLRDVEEAILEPNGTISVILRHPTGEEQTLRTILARLDRLERRLAREPL